MPLGLLLIAGGGLLVIGAVTNRHPWAPLVRAFGGQEPPVPGAASAAALDSAISGTGGGGTANVPPSGAVAGLGALASLPGDTTAAAGICAAGGWAPTPDNIAGLNAWIACEKPAGAPMQWNNPLNTEQDHGFGGHPAPGFAVLEFPTPAAGFAANAATIKQSNFTGVNNALSGGVLGSEILRTNGGILGDWGTNPTCVTSRLRMARPLVQHG